MPRSADSKRKAFMTGCTNRAASVAQTKCAERYMKIGGGKADLKKRQGLVYSNESLGRYQFKTSKAWNNFMVVARKHPFLKPEVAGLVTTSYPTALSELWKKHGIDAEAKRLAAGNGAGNLFIGQWYMDQLNRVEKYIEGAIQVAVDAKQGGRRIYPKAAPARRRSRSRARSPSPARAAPARARGLVVVESDDEDDQEL